MILKIRGHERWWLYGNVDRVCIYDERFPYDKVKADQEFSLANLIIAEEIVSSPEILLEGEGLKVECSPLCHITVRYSDNSEDSFFFNTEAFVMNDEGKTVEIIR